jgi:hypothetical protein
MAGICGERVSFEVFPQNETPHPASQKNDTEQFDADRKRSRKVRKARKLRFLTRRRREKSEVASRKVRKGLKVRN